MGQPLLKLFPTHNERGSISQRHRLMLVASTCLNTLTCLRFKRLCRAGAYALIYALRRWARYIGLLLTSFCLVWGLATSAQAQTSLTWEDLQPAAIAQKNPYAHLSLEQTYDLSMLARLQTWVEANQAKPASLEVQEMRRLDKKLQAQALDVTALLAQVEQAQAYWHQQSQSTNSRWTGQTIALSGYVLPLTWNQMWPSIAMVIAISIGMAITLAWIGALALMGRNYANRQIDNRCGNRFYHRLHRWLKFAGSCCVLLIGLGLFGMTLASGS